MKVSRLTESQIAYIQANRLLLSGTEMAKNFGLGKHVVNDYMRKSGLQVPKALVYEFRRKIIKGRTSFTKKEDAEILANYLRVPIKQLAERMGRSFTGIMGRLGAMGLEIPLKLREERKAQGMIKTGNVPHNKGLTMPLETYNKVKRTFFLKGHQPHNTKEKNGVVSNRVDKNGRKYNFIRVSIGKWIPLARYVWEEKHGALPKGSIVVFKDGNANNCLVENLEAITRKQNVLRNSLYRFGPDIALSFRLLKKLKRKVDENKNE